MSLIRYDGQEPRPSPTADELVPRTPNSPSLTTHLRHTAVLSTIYCTFATLGLLQSCREFIYPPAHKPDIVKTYDCRTYLPVRIFFPSSYDQTSPDTLPTLFVVHGGGYIIGHASENDRWNRTFADTHGALVIAFEYRKAPRYPFPTALYDIEALYLAAVSDASLPTDQLRVAVAGFSAGGNLAAGLCQLDSVRNGVAAPAALLAVYPTTDFALPSEPKSRKRPYKPGLGRFRGDATDYVAALANAFCWAYVPYGHPLTDPLLSTSKAPRDRLPAHVCVVAAELDYLAHDAWQLACHLAGRREPGLDGIVGRAEVARETGVLELEDPRFAWEQAGVKWLLVPDVVHAFDRQELMRSWLDKDGAVDAEAKTRLYMAEAADWLRRTAWK